MSKFLTIIEEALTGDEIDKRTEAKNELVRFLRQKDVTIRPRVFKDIVYITLENGKVLTLEIKEVVLPKQEEQEDQVNIVGKMFNSDPEIKRLKGELTGQIKKEIEELKR
jgi:hypothetical protein